MKQKPKKPAAPFNPIVSEAFLKQWWRRQITRNNKPKEEK